jgi:hypothetical protein
VELLPPLPLQAPLAGTGSRVLLPPLQLLRQVAAACRVHRAPHSGVAQLPPLPLPVVVSGDGWLHTSNTLHPCNLKAQHKLHTALSCTVSPYNQGHACTADILHPPCCAALQVELLPPLPLLAVGTSGSRLLPPPLQPLLVAGLVQALPPPLLRQVAAACRAPRPPSSGVAQLPPPPLPVVVSDQHGVVLIGLPFEGCVVLFIPAVQRLHHSCALRQAKHAAALCLFTACCR